MKKMIIIGAGIAGLTAGIYGRLNGFDTEIYEMHSMPGGECTGWTRGKYYFDGCIHWLLGSKPGNPLNDIWREVGALDDSIRIINNDIIYCLKGENQDIYAYRDLEKLEAHFKEIAPEDSEVIGRLCKAIKAMKSMTMPTEKPMDKMNVIDMLKMIYQMRPALKYVSKFEKQTVGEFLGQFKSLELKKALSLFIPGHYSATGLVSTLASYADGDGGWPMGGSLAMAKRMEDKYLSLGGKVFYKSKADKILVENGKASGIMLSDGSKSFGDYVISAADGHATLFDMLEGKYMDDRLKAMYDDQESYPVYTSLQISLGIDCDLSNYPHTLYVPLEKDIDCGGAVESHMGFKHFCYDNTLMPEGKSALIAALPADFDWWKNIYNNKESYNREKQRIADEVIYIVEKYYPETVGKIEVVDVATPMTYVRYCNAWKGAWMSFAMTPRGKVRYIPGNLQGLEGFYMTGQWTMPPGGLPVAVVTGRWVIQRICGIEKSKFVTK